MQQELTSEVINNGRPAIIAGALKTAQVVTSSMGVGKKQVAISYANTFPFPSPDGATIAGAIKLEDRVERIGSDWALQAAKLTAKQAGDGTTTCMQILSGILSRFDERSSVRQLTGELTEAAVLAEKLAKDWAIPVTNESQLQKVATISANNDPVLGKLISDLVWKVGKHGAIYVEDSDLLETQTELKKGYVLKPGLADEKFMAKSPRGFSWSSPKVILIDDHVFDPKQLKVVYDRFVHDCASKQTGQLNDSLLMVFTRIDGSALESIVGAFLQGGKMGPMPIIAATLAGRYKDDIMADLSKISGAPIFSEKYNNPLAKLRVAGHFSKQHESPFGVVPKITFSSEEITLFFEEELVDEHIKDLEGQSFPEEARENLRLERLSKLTNGVGYIRIGGTSNAGMIGTGQLIDDAQMACINALRDGYLFGGGYTILAIADELDIVGTGGARLLAKSLRGCFKKMLENSEYKLSFLGSTKKYQKQNHVFNMKTGEFEPVSNTQVLDAAKAVQCAIRNSVSVACEIIKTGPALLWK